jgi:YD repeat-containing protein
VRLEVDASAVGLEGKTLNGMAFTLYGGRAYWDKAGKVAFNGLPINNSVYAVDAATNRLTSVNGAPMSYDAAGNQINDGSGQRTYDAENRMLTAINGGVSSSYTYDTDGRRVRRIVGVQETWQVYGIGGELLAEYAAGGASNTPQKEYGYRNGQMLVVWDGSETGDRQLQWLVQDHLGSTRMVVDRSGSLAGSEARAMVTAAIRCARSSMGMREIMRPDWIMCRRAITVQCKAGLPARIHSLGEKPIRRH